MRREGNGDSDDGVRRGEAVESLRAQGASLSPLIDQHQKILKQNQSALRPDHSLTTPDQYSGSGLRAPRSSRKNRRSLKSRLFSKLWRQLLYLITNDDIRAGTEGDEGSRWLAREFTIAEICAEALLTCYRAR